MRRPWTLAGRLRMLAPALIALSSLAPVVARAQSEVSGPWVLSRDGYYATARLGWFNPSTYFDANGVRVSPVPAETFHGRDVGLEAMYGISNRLTFHLGMPVLFQSLEVPSLTPNKFSNNGFGDLTFGFKYGFLDPASRQAVALEILANTPTGYNPYGVGRPPLGLGKFNSEVHLHGGMTLDPAPVYAQAEVGYRKFSDSAVSDALLYGAEAGFFATSRVLVVGRLDAQKGRDDTKLFFLSFTEAEGLVQYRLKPHVDVMVGYASVLSGKNVTKSNVLRLGVALKGNRLGKYRGQVAAGAAEGTFPGMAPRAIVPAAAPTPAPAAIPAPEAPAPAPAPADTSHAPSQPK
jgi:hypothetical protein